MDPMSDVLAAMHVRGFGYARLEAHAPWGVHYPHHNTSLGMIVRGNCLLDIEGSNASIPLTGGDCFLVPHGHGHTLRSDSNVIASPFSEVFTQHNATANREGDGPLAVVVGGWFRLDKPSSQPLMRHLPPLILIHTDQAQTLALHATLQQMAVETATSAPGTQVVINRLAEVLFIQMIRAHISSQYAIQTGWLGALGDKAVGAALLLMHHRVQDAWTVASIADAIGVSRSVFARRFKQLVGESPLEYLTNWRIFKASELLRGTDLKLIRVAHAVGYESDTAFSRVFRRVTGESPGHYRVNSRRRTRS